jgi:predicted O-methyltransferase YrrM
MAAELLDVARRAKGFMPEEEGLALHEVALDAGTIGPLLEIGTYCGKSAVYLGAAARERGTILYTIDHHRGSLEMQSGWDHHDEELIDPKTGLMDSFPFFEQTMAQANLEDVVVALVGDSATIAQDWTTHLGLVFIDGAHSEEPARIDYEAWAPKIAKGGVLAIHDVFPDPKDGGQGPFRIYERALDSGKFVEERAEGSLRVLRRET